MIHTAMVLQPYTPQIHLGDWQIVVFVNRRRNRVSVERRHSSEKESFDRSESGGESLRINTGIRAFRRQMPVLAVALEKIDTTDKADAEIIEAVFQLLATVYRAAPEHDRIAGGDEHLAAEEFGEFLEYRKRAALMALSIVIH